MSASTPLPTTPPANVQQWTVEGPVPMPCCRCGKPASYWAHSTIWFCVPHWEEYFEACKKVTPPVPTTRPSQHKEVATPSSDSSLAGHEA